MHKLLALTLLAASAAMVGCSSEKPAAAPQGNTQSSANTEAGENSSSLSIDTEDGGFSYEEKSGGNSTSINIGDDEK